MSNAITGMFSNSRFATKTIILQHDPTTTLVSHLILKTSNLSCVGGKFPVIYISVKNEHPNFPFSLCHGWRILSHWLSILQMSNQRTKIVPAKEDVDVVGSVVCSSELLLWLEVSMSSPSALCPPSVFILELCDMELSMEHRDSWSSDTSRRKLEARGRMWLDKSRYGTSCNTRGKTCHEAHLV